MLPVSHVGTALLVAAIVAGGSVAPRSIEAQPGPASGARVAGQVRADSTGRPIAGAVVLVVGSERTTRTDTLGRFMLPAVPAGPRALSVRAIGFAEREVPLVLTNGDSIDVAVRLAIVSLELATVTVTASTERRSIFFDDFTARRRTSNGRFLDYSQFAEDFHQPLSTILRTRMPGVRIVRYGGGRMALASNRGVDSFTQMPQGDAYDRNLGAPKACYVQVIINNALVYGGGREETLYNVDLLQPERVEAVEFYTSSTVPPEFNRGSSSTCGALVLWLRP